LLIYLLFLGIGLSELKAIRWASVGLTLGLVLIVLTVLQSFFTANWTMADSAKLVVYRMAASYPYYLSLYPEVIPYCGIDCGLHLLGLAEPKTDALDVWSYMYPRDRWVQGMTPAAAHVRAYAEAGVPYSLAMMVAIGAIIHAISQLRGNARGPI